MVNFQHVKSGVSCLLRKPPKTNINPKSLGYIHPDGKISFATAEVAETYAKNRAVSALKEAKPFERGVLYKDNLILGEINGEAINMDVSSFGNMTGTTFAHGHPEILGQTFPLSLMDYLTMKSQGMKKVIAYSINGEHSTLTAEKGKSVIIRFLPKKWQEKLKFLETIGCGSLATESYAKKYASLFPENLRKKMETGIHFEVKSPYGSSSKIKYYNGAPTTQEEQKQAKESLIPQIKDGSFNKMVHEFWQDIAPKINCKYETNFSDFV